MALEVKIKGLAAPIPKQWPKYIANPKNKTNLCAVVAEPWCQMEQENMPVGQQIVLGGGFRDGRRAVLLTKGGCEDLLSLVSDHEEADTRILLHADHAAHDYKRIVIHSPDTTVYCTL